MSDAAQPPAPDPTGAPKEPPAKLGAFPVVLFFLALAAAAAWFAPEDWRWPAIGSALFVAIIVAMRSVSVAIGKAVEKKFNGDE